MTDNFLDEGDSYDDKEFVLDEINGRRNRKPIMSALNKTKLSKQEMDDLFCFDF